MLLNNALTFFSGKSTLISAILRLVDPTPPESSGATNNSKLGQILIDDIPIIKISRKSLRSRLLAIPQETLILSGTIRFNANPFHATISSASDQKNVDDKSYDDLIISTLRKVGLWEGIEARGGLDGELTPQSFSQGEGQLFSIARTIIRKDIANMPRLRSTFEDDGDRNEDANSVNRPGRGFRPMRPHNILLMDEATSNVDADTDATMQELIQREFRNFTIVTVAHRIETIKDSDVIGVMEDGRMVQFGPTLGTLSERFK